MRFTSISLHNNQSIELYCKRVDDWYDFYLVASLKDRRFIIDHHHTYDDIESVLEYAKPRDLIWRDCSDEQLPLERDENAIIREQGIKNGEILSYVTRPIMQGYDITYHLGNYGLIPVDKSELKQALVLLIGSWSDGNITFTLGKKNELNWRVLVKDSALDRLMKYAPDLWNMKKWRLYFTNTEHAKVLYVDIIHVGKTELHITATGVNNRMVQIFRRI